MHYLIFDVVAHGVVWFGHTVSLPRMSCGSESFRLTNLQMYDTSANCYHFRRFMPDGVMAPIVAAQSCNCFDIPFLEKWMTDAVDGVVVCERWRARSAPPPPTSSHARRSQLHRQAFDRLLFNWLKWWWSYLVSSWPCTMHEGTNHVQIMSTLSSGLHRWEIPLRRARMGLWRRATSMGLCHAHWQWVVLLGACCFCTCSKFAGCIHDIGTRHV